MLNFMRREKIIQSTYMYLTAEIFYEIQFCGFWKKLQAFCKIFTHCFLHFKIFTGLNFAAWDKSRKILKFSSRKISSLKEDCMSFAYSIFNLVTNKMLDLNSGIWLFSSFSEL